MGEFKETEFLVCIPWERRPIHTLFEQVKRLCANCDGEIVMDARNERTVAEHGIMLLCVPCWAVRSKTLRADGALIGGEHVKLFYPEDN